MEPEDILDELETTEGTTAPEEHDDPGDSQEYVAPQEATDDDNTISAEEWDAYQKWKAERDTPAAAPREVRQEAAPQQPNQNEFLEGITDRLASGDPSAVRDMMTLMLNTVRAEIAPTQRNVLLSSIPSEIRPAVEAAERELGVTIDALPENQRRFVIEAATLKAKASQKPSKPVRKAPTVSEGVTPARPGIAIPKELATGYRDFLKTWGLQDSKETRQQFMEA